MKRFAVRVDERDQATGVWEGPTLVDALTSIDGLLGREVPLRFEFWDRSMLCHDQSVATLRFNSPDAIRRLLWMPNDLGLGRAYVAGDLDLDGDIFDLVVALRDTKPTTAATVWRVLPTQ